MLYELVRDIRECPEYIPLIEDLCNIKIDKSILNKNIKLEDTELYMIFKNISDTEKSLIKQYVKQHRVPTDAKG